MNQRRWLLTLGLILLLVIGLLGWRHVSHQTSASATDEKDHVGIAPGAVPFSPDHKNPERRPKRNPQDSGKTNFVKRMMHGDMPDILLTKAQVEEFLTHQGRTAESLLAASRIASEDPSQYLQEAARRFPDHPMVQLELLLRFRDPGEQRAILDRLRKLDPGNSLGDLLSASLGFKEGHPEQALQDLELSLSHPRFDSYMKTYAGQQELAYRMAGFGDLDARAAALFGMQAAELEPMRELGRSVEQARTDAIARGDTETARRLMQAELAASRSLRQDPPTVVQELVAISVESKLLTSLPPEEIQPDGRSAAQVLADLDTRKNQLRELSTSQMQRLQELSDEDLMSYLSKVRQSGEARAMEDLRDGQR